MKTRIKYLLKETVRLFTLPSLFILLLVPLSFAQSEETEPYRDTYTGIEGGFGFRSFTLESDIPQLNQLTTVKGGGSLGVIYGTQTFKFPVVMGLYYAAIEEKRTIDLFTLQAGVNTSLLSLIGFKNSPIDVYTITNVEFQSFSFMGHYIKFPENQPRKEIFGETVMGRKRMINTNLGVGLELKLRDDSDFIHLFIEAKKSFTLNSSSTTYFNNTRVNNKISLNVGLRVGVVK